jgi:hypothetical protein
MTNDILNELECFITNEARMPAGLIVTVINEVERLRKKEQDLRILLEQDACEIERLKKELALLQLVRQSEELGLYEWQDDHLDNETDDHDSIVNRLLALNHPDAADAADEIERLRRSIAMTNMVRDSEEGNMYEPTTGIDAVMGFIDRNERG